MYKDTRIAKKKEDLTKRICLVLRVFFFSFFCFVFKYPFMLQELFFTILRQLKVTLVELTVAKNDNSFFQILQQALPPTWTGAKRTICTDTMVEKHDVLALNG